jgi:hypothetical protein
VNTLVRPVFLFWVLAAFEKSFSNKIEGGLYAGKNVSEVVPGFYVLGFVESYIIDSSLMWWWGWRW